MFIFHTKLWNCQIVDKVIQESISLGGLRISRISSTIQPRIARAQSIREYFSQAYFSACHRSDSYNDQTDVKNHYEDRTSGT